jgi:hypothetical protein
VTPA